MVLCLCEIRYVNKKIYLQSAWRKVVQETGFAQVCWTICRPQNVVHWKHPHIQDLLRKNRIPDSILVQKQKTLKTVLDRICKTNGGLKILDGQSLLQALIKHDNLIPRVLYPQAVYFVLSLNNFVQIWHLFMGAELYSLGYDVGMAYFNQQWKPEEHSILQRTQQFTNLKNSLNNYAFRHNLEYSVDEMLIGCGITLAPVGHRLLPKLPKKSKHRKDGTYRKPGPPPEILDANDPDLVCVSSRQTLVVSSAVVGI
ncbi:hypothetical protein C8R45DRAFT_943858 [Mycena sanguinolenta]|nr:hypothetical protein C8R45DRAFT_943858 [Mycena sanguinolenta]